jgi:hypothetical protein
VTPISDSGAPPRRPSGVGAMLAQGFVEVRDRRTRRLLFLYNPATHTVAIRPHHGQHSRHGNALVQIIVNLNDYQAATAGTGESDEP